MASYSELELRYARPLAHTLLESDSFRQWFFAGTKHEKHAVDLRALGEVQHGLRSRTMKNPYWFNYWCGKDSKCVCRIGSGIETDILLIFDCANHRRLGLHIEVKRPREQLGNGQAESYPRRAACWVNPSTRPKTVPPHDEFTTMLVCGSELGTDERVRFFDKVVFHEDVAKRIAVYPEM